jgi:predicted transcriptional regulator
MRDARVGDGPLSINELTCRPERDYEDVNSDVTRLIEPGLSER